MNGNEPRPAIIAGLVIVSSSLFFPRATFAGDGFASLVTAYDPGSGAAPGFTNPAAALGQPARFTGEGIFPSVVSPFSSPFDFDQIVSLGQGGSITLLFDEPITDDPANPFGIDLIVFGNQFFIDASWPSGIVGGFFGETGLIEVSEDGATWHAVAPLAGDLFPTLGWLDSGPYDTVPGREPTNFRRPIDPLVAEVDLTGLDHSALVELYDHSGGGTGIDLSPTGLSAISQVRITFEGEFGSLEIDAVSDVTPLLAGDVSGDGTVGFDDLVIVLAQWGACSCAADLDGDDMVGLSDVLIILANWT